MSIYNNKTKIKRKRNRFDINIKLNTPPYNWDYRDVANFIEREKPEFISSFSHELMHWFDNEKRKNLSKSRLGKYNAKDIKLFKNIYPINNFLFLLYFTHSVENVVRSTEFASRLKSQKVTRKNFLEFLRSDVTYQTLNRAKDFSYESLKNNLKAYVVEIEEVLRKLNIATPVVGLNINNIPKTTSDFAKIYEEEIDQILNSVRLFIADGVLTNYYNALVLNMLADFNIKEYLPDKFLKSVGKFNSNDAFYKHEEKILNNIGDKMIRKLSKLYDTVDNSFEDKIKSGKEEFSEEELDVRGDINLEKTKIKSLPNGLTVSGNLILNYCKNLTSLPDNLTVGGFLEIRSCNITELPIELKVGKWLDLQNTPLVKKYTTSEIDNMCDIKGSIYK
jgi:hypothetical protein